MSQLHSAAPPLLRLLDRSVAVRHLILTLLFGAVTALAAQIKWYLPDNPVPITGQVFVVLLAGALLGARLGSASQLVYIGFGLLGAPVFAGGVGGPAVLIGPTGGYLIGFVLAAHLAGTLASRRQSVGVLTAAMAAGLAAIYLCGAVWLAIWLHLAQSLSWSTAIARGITQGVAPFVPWDLAKVALAVWIARRMVR